MSEYREMMEEWREEDEKEKDRISEFDYLEYELRHLLNKGFITEKLFEAMKIWRTEENTKITKENKESLEEVME